MRIRAAGVEDAGEIARIHLEAWREAYDGLLPPALLAAVGGEEQELRWVGILSRQGSPDVTLAAVDAFDRIVGFAAAGPARSGGVQGTAELYAVAVVPEHRRRGLGTRLVAAAGARLLEQGWTRLLARVPDRDPARSFCLRLGARPLDRPDPAARPGLEVTLIWEDLRTLVSRRAPPGEPEAPAGAR